MQRVTWRVATLAERRSETRTASTLVLDVPGWPGHQPGQHVDVRLTAEDGYSTQRSYSLAAPARDGQVEITVQRVPGGEVSPYLSEVFEEGDQVELRGPVGGWFVWRPSGTLPVLLVGGGSGVVPLMAMIRARRETGSRTPFRLVYSVRTPADLIYAAELRRPEPGLDVTIVYTRSAPAEVSRRPGRLAPGDLGAAAWPVDLEPECFVCGPTAFVETVADILQALGHDPRRIKTERFGPTGG